jgi:hypothetical protein
MAVYHLLLIKTLGAFDFSYRPSLAEKEIMKLSSIFLGK